MAKQVGISVSAVQRIWRCTRCSRIACASSRQHLCSLSISLDPWCQQRIRTGVGNAGERSRLIRTGRCSGGNARFPAGDRACARETRRAGAARSAQSLATPQRPTRFTPRV
jgi:hypothetical protein